MAAHESPRTTKLYDRTGDEITHSMKLRRSKSNLEIPTADVVIFSSAAFAPLGTRCQTRFCVYKPARATKFRMRGWPTAKPQGRRLKEARPICPTVFGRAAARRAARQKDAGLGYNCFLSFFGSRSAARPHIELRLIGVGGDREASSASRP
jgi:hypothetical protein